MITIFLDSNVLISALIGSAHSPPVILMDWIAGNAEFELITGRCCVQEVEKNIARKLPQAQPLWTQFVLASGIRVVPCPRMPVLGINAKDEPVVAAAIAAGANHCVTGDKRLLAEMRRTAEAAPLAMTARELLDALVTSR